MTWGGEIFDAHHVLPEYFVISIPSFNDVIKQEIDEWLYVMKHSAVREDFHSPYMSQVAERLSVLKLTSEERSFYDEEKLADLKARDYLTSAEAKGREEGMQAKEIEIAKNMLSKGYTHEEVQDLTGLSMSQIAQLAQETT